MADSKEYVSVKAGFTIIRPAVFKTVMQDGQPVNVRQPRTPIQFSNHRYSTADPDEQEAIEEHSEFGETLEEGNVAPAPQYRDLEAALEQKEDEEPLEEKLEAAESPEEVAQILDEYNLPSLPEDVETNTSDGEAISEAEEDVSDEEEDVPEPPADDLEVIHGVTNKGDALSALESIPDLEVEVSSNDNVDEIADFAESKGYTFDDWPR